MKARNLEVSSDKKAGFVSFTPAGGHVLICVPSGFAPIVEEVIDQLIDAGKAPADFSSIRGEVPREWLNEFYRAIAARIHIKVSRRMIGVRERSADGKGAVTSGHGLLQYCQQLEADLLGVVG